MKQVDIKVITRFGKVEWLLLGGILATGTVIAVFTALIFRSM